MLIILSCIGSLEHSHERPICIEGSMQVLATVMHICNKNLLHFVNKMSPYSKWSALIWYSKNPCSRSWVILCDELKVQKYLTCYFWGGLQVMKLQFVIAFPQIIHNIMVQLNLIWFDSLWKIHQTLKKIIANGPIVPVNFNLERIFKIDFKNHWDHIWPVCKVIVLCWIQIMTSKLELRNKLLRKKWVPMQKQVMFFKSKTKMISILIGKFGCIRAPQTKI